MKRTTARVSGVPGRLRAFLGSELRKAQGRLKPADGRDSEVSVHEARKSIKKLRAGLRLAAKMFKKSRRRKAESRLRAAEHLLSPLRDSKVLKKTVNDLRKGKESVPRRGKPPSTQVPLRKAREELRKAGAALDGLPGTRAISRRGEPVSSGFTGARVAR